MEKPNTERNGGAGGLMGLPIGFRFHPTDEELVVHYLKRKLHSLPLPASVIPELDVFRINPWDLPGDLRENRYFFYDRKIGKEDVVSKCTSNTSSIIRRRVVGLWRTTCGYWKATGGYKQILASGPVSGSKQQVVGMRRSLAFYFHRGNRRSEWVMREYYCLLGSPPTPPPYSTHRLYTYHQNLVTQLFGNWVVCRIHQKKQRNAQCGHGITSPTGGSSSNNKKRSSAHPAIGKICKELISSSTTWNFNMEDFGGPPSTPSSSCSSGITEIPSNFNHDSLQDQEAISDNTNSRSKGAY